MFIFYRAPSKCVNLLIHGNNCKLNKERHCYICCFIYSSEVVLLGSFISEYLNLFFNSCKKMYVAFYVLLVDFQSKAVEISLVKNQNI